MIRTVAAALIATAALTVAGSAAAATSGTIKLNGKVDLACSVSVQDLNQQLNLAGGDSNKAVGKVTETCNSGNGYRISISSQNGGKLRGERGTEIGYQVNYDNQGGTLGSAMNVDRAGARFGQQYDLKVSVQGSDQYIAGAYEDTLTVTIAAK
ncbi:spore coat protein U domain-containing protein [Indioceanicola profundi]|uniref:spore coat protein U domain-containing protein n=1 Tax=Indioceanicola profundi TaxID=2220096 RepID=UPI000E6AD279|nr:spore coat protein U domain-containing protein [Indioceanicola profundi]